ncbi:hypothetical protein [Nannocystis pusilla]|uniref:hypothetical protein n=1 Tax=Nannocystis pusilla TaxID=889268 RepID=UPI003B7B3C06
MSFAVDREQRRVHASVLGLAGRTAVHRDGLGCALAIGVAPEALQAQTIAVQHTPQATPRGRPARASALPPIRPASTAPPSTPQSLPRSASRTPTRCDSRAPSSSSTAGRSSPSATPTASLAARVTSAGRCRRASRARWSGSSSAAAA